MKTWVSYGLFFAVLVSLAAGPYFFASAQEFGGTSVASSFVIAGEVADGDVIVFDPETESYGRTTRRSDERMFGVVVDDPVLHVAEVDGALPGARPVVRTGEAVVNVTTIAGVIRTGDLITTSSLAGLGERATQDTSVYLLGVALADMTLTPNVRTDLPGGVQYGRVPVALRVGQYLPGEDEKDKDEATTTVPVPVTVGTTDEPDLDYFMMFRYVLAAIVVLLAIIISLRNFGGALSQSVIAVGRNPLARASIYSMMLWNSLFILIVSGVGLAIGVAIIVL